MGWIIVIGLFVFFLYHTVGRKNSKPNEVSEPAQKSRRRIRISIDDQINDLNKRVTAFKKAKDYDQAIEALQKSYKLMKLTRTQYTVKNYLRAPMILQLAGRNEEAWDAYLHLLKAGYPHQSRSRDTVLMEKYAIYDKMRLHLQRTKEPVEAIVYQVLSTLCWSEALRLQNRSSEHEHTLTEEYSRASVEPALKKATMTSATDEVTEVLRTMLNDPRNLNIQSAEEKLRTLLKSLAQSSISSP